MQPYMKVKREVSQTAIEFGRAERTARHKIDDGYMARLLELKAKMLELNKRGVG